MLQYESISEYIYIILEMISYSHSRREKLFHLILDDILFYLDTHIVLFFPSPTSNAEHLYMYTIVPNVA